MTSLIIGVSRLSQLEDAVRAMSGARSETITVAPNICISKASERAIVWV